MCLAVLFKTGPSHAVDALSTPTREYEDRLIDGGTLAPDVSDSPDDYDQRGWPRAIRVEGVTSYLKRSGVSVREDGIAAGGFVDTPAFGSFTLDGTFRTDGKGSGTFWQRALPVTGGWRVNNGLGVLNTPAIDLARTQTRFYLPSTPVAGITSEWRNAHGLLLNAGGGEPGVFDGIRLPVFEGLGGNVATAGAQFSPSPGWVTGAQVATANDVPLGFGPLLSTERISATSWFGATAWQGANARVQGNLVGSRMRSDVNSGPDQDARLGGWIDAYVQDGRVGHSFGAFRLAPDLTWVNQLISSDAQGAYYRASYQSRQWLIDGGVDRVVSVSGDGLDITYATGSVRHQYSRDFGLGGGANVRRDIDTAYSAFAYVDRVVPWGITRGQFDVAHDSPQRDVQLTLDQSWNVPTGARLSTAVSVGRATDENNVSGNRISFAILGGGDLTSRVSIDGNARWTRSNAAGSATNSFANIALNWRLASNLALSVVYYENRTDTAQPLTVVSPIAQPIIVESFRDRGFFLTLRFDARAGRASAPLGGRPGDGAGRVSGVIYLDANDDGRLDAGEQGAPNVTVILDGRYVARTDSQGRFEFPSVVEGRHVVTVVPDNLPLPWVVKNDGRTELNVAVRSSTQVEIPAQRIR